jgi:hypothetical protein
LKKPIPNTSNQKRMKQFLFLFGICLATVAMGQVEKDRDVISAGGDNMANGSLSLSWTLGEPMVESLSESNLTLCQGFHQGGCEIVGVTEVLAFPVKVYPNPTTDEVFIEAEASEPLTTVLYDLTGKTLFEKTWEMLAYPVVVPVEGLPAATYFLRLVARDGRSNLFKIQKF